MKSGRSPPPQCVWHNHCINEDEETCKSNNNLIINMQNAIDTLRVLPGDAATCQEISDKKCHFGAIPAAGFSLIELLIVVAIIGIVASLGVPALQKGIMAAENGNTFATMKII